MAVADYLKQCVDLYTEVIVEIAVHGHGRSRAVLGTASHLICSVPLVEGTAVTLKECTLSQGSAVKWLDVIERKKGKKNGKVQGKNDGRKERLNGGRKE